MNIKIDKKRFMKNYRIAQEKMKADIIKNIDRLDEKSIAFVYKFFEGYKN